MFRVILMLITVNNAAFEVTNNVKLLTQLYETHLNTSRKLDREDRALVNNWTVEFQVKRVNVTTNYRMQMTKHKEHSFRRNDINAKWNECVFLHRREIRKSEKDYYVDESECLTTITADDNERMQAVVQVEKESRKWRKGYRYLVNTCTKENPEGEEAADICLIQYGSSQSGETCDAVLEVGLDNVNMITDSMPGCATSHTSYIF